MRLSRVEASVLISLITGQARWGNFLYAANSTILGSIKTKRISLAVFLQTSPAIRLLIKTLLPDQWCQQSRGAAFVPDLQPRVRPGCRLQEPPVGSFLMNGTWGS